MVSYGGKAITRWQTAAIFKIDISPYLSEKSSHFHEILYTVAVFELVERHVIKNEKLACHWTDSEFNRTYISCIKYKKRFAEVVTVSQITSFDTGGETSRAVAKRPGSGIETSKGATAKRPGGTVSRYRSV